LKGNFNIHLKDIEPPARADASEVELTMQPMQDHNASVTITFIDRYMLNLVIPACYAYQGDAPETIEETLQFVGISTKYVSEKQKQKARDWELGKKWRGQASSHESWFEMNHPMGSFAQARYLGY
jgi:hypothetical protein